MNWFAAALGSHVDSANSSLWQAVSQWEAIDAQLTTLTDRASTLHTKASGKCQPLANDISGPQIYLFIYLLDLLTIDHRAYVIAHVCHSVIPSFRP